MSDRLAAFRWRDALDILLVAIVIYRVFVMFRGTRAVQMMIGISALATASLLARQLELYSTEWLLLPAFCRPTSTSRTGFSRQLSSGTKRGAVSSAKAKG